MGHSVLTKEMLIQPHAIRNLPWRAPKDGSPLCILRLPGGIYLHIRQEPVQYFVNNDDGWHTGKYWLHGADRMGRIMPVQLDANRVADGPVVVATDHLLKDCLHEILDAAMQHVRGHGRNGPGGGRFGGRGVY